MTYYLKLDETGLAVGPGEWRASDPGAGWAAGSEANYLERWNGSAWEATAESAALAAAQVTDAANAIANRKQRLKDLLDAAGDSSKLLRVVVGMVVDELNILRERDRAWQNAFATASGGTVAAVLQDLRNKVAAFATLDDRTLQDAVTKAKNIIG